MDITAIFKAVLAPDKEQTPDGFASLKPGDKLMGKVLRLEADGQVLLDLGRFRALAHTTFPVQVGQRLPLKVVQTGVPTQLRLDIEAASKSQHPLPQMALTTLFSGADQQRITQAIEHLLSRWGATQATAVPGATAGQSGPTLTQIAAGAQAIIPTQGVTPDAVQQALVHLKSIFEPLAIEAPVAQQAQWVQSAVTDRGVLFELKLAAVLEPSTPTHGPGPAEAKPAMPNGSPMPLKTPVSSRQGPEVNIVPDVPTESSAQFKPNAAKGLDTGTGTQPATPAPPTTIGEPAKAAQAGISAALQAGADPGSVKDLIAQSVAPMVPDIRMEAESKAIPHEPDAPAIAEIVRRIVDHDLKPQLHILKSFLGAMDEQGANAMETKAKDVAFLRQAVNQLLGHVEQQQEQAVRRSAEPDVYQVFTHLLPVKDHSPPVRLKVYYPKKGGPARDDPRHRIALLLDMDQLGPVRADLSMVERQLSIHFYVRDEKVQHAFAQQTQAVAEALQGVFEQVVIETQVSKEKIAQFEGEDLVGPPVGRINVQV